MVKKNILFITTCLQKAGAEKYLFELISNLDKDQFNCEVLTVSNVITEQDFPHYYYPKLLKLNIKVHTFLDFPYIRLKKRTLTFFNKLIYKLLQYINTIYYFFFKNGHFKRVNNIIDKADWIGVIDILNYHSIVKTILDQKNNFDIHLMCHKSQFNYDIYANLEPDKAYNFTYIDSLQLTEILASNRKIKATINFPLSLDVNKSQIDRFTTTYNIQNLRIGVFTRINAIKPIDEFILAFSKILSEFPNTELHIFGHIQDLDYYKTLQELITANAVSSDVTFHGHVDDMLTSIRDNQINLVWMLSVNNFIGYASIEIGIHAVPMVFLNIEKDNIKSNEDDVIKCVTSASELAFTTIKLMQNETITSVGDQIRSNMIITHDIKKNIKLYENAILDLINTSEN